MNKEHLALAQKLPPNRCHHLSLVIGAHKGQNGMTLLGRGGQRGHLSNPGDRHLQGPRDWCRAHSEDIHIGLECFERVFVFHSESLLFIDDDQAQVFEGHRLG